MSASQISTLVEDEVRTELLFPFIDTCEVNALYVELGVFVGGNMARVAEYAKNKNKSVRMVGIDNWQFQANGLSPQSMAHASISYSDNFEQVCLDNLKPYQGITILSGDTNDLCKEFEDESIDCIFIDALHTSYEYHVNEIKMWLPKVKTGGLVTGHDWPCDGICRAVKDVFSDKNIIISSSNGGYKVVK